MTPERYREVGRIFRAAAEVPPDRRAAFLDAACGEDQALRQEVESLFVHDAQGEEWIDGRALEVAAQALARKPHESWVGRQVPTIKFLPWSHEAAWEKSIKPATHG